MSEHKVFTIPNRGDELRVSLVVDHGRTKIAVRRFYPSPDGTMRASREGLSLSAKLARELAEVLGRVAR